MKMWKIAGIAVVVVLAASLVSGTLAFAQTEDPATGADGQTEQTAPAPTWGLGGPRGGRMGHGPGLSQVGLEAAAEALGMTADALSAQLWGGMTLADLADEAGVDLQDVRDAVEAANQAATRDAIEQAVEDGDLTREHADWLLEGLDNGYWDGRGFGHGMHWGAFEAPDQS